MRIKSEVDMWFKYIIYITIMILLGCLLIVPKERLMITLAISAVSIAFLLWILKSTYYEFRENYLYCRSGPFFEKIHYANIRYARLSNNKLSSMALSSKRIEIRQHNKGYFLGTTMISPVNREEFLQELLKRCKNLK